MFLWGNTPEARLNFMKYYRRRDGLLGAIAEGLLSPHRTLSSLMLGRPYVHFTDDDPARVWMLDQLLNFWAGKDQEEAPIKGDADERVNS